MKREMSIYWWRESRARCSLELQSSNGEVSGVDTKGLGVDAPQDGDGGVLRTGEIDDLVFELLHLHGCDAGAGEREQTQGVASTSPLYPGAFISGSQGAIFAATAV